MNEFLDMCMKKNLFFCLVFLVFLGCTSDDSNQRNEKSIEEIRTGDGIRNSDIIRNPVTADEPLDTVNVAKMVFDLTTYEYGRVEAGDIVNHTFKFKNAGKVPLLITNARSTCGCTVPDWPKEPIEPGDSGEIKVKFNTTGKKNQNNKPIYITANTYPVETKIYLAGWVEAKD